jgi:hypothetical protein
MRRETAEAAHRRRAELARDLALSARKRQRRMIVLGANGAALILAGVVVGRFVSRSREIRERLERVEAPWFARGFSELASNALTASLSIESDLPGQSCLVAVSTGEGPIRITDGIEIVHGAHSAGWCTCGPGHARVEATAGLGVTGLAILRIDERATGGPLARGWLDYAPGAWDEPHGDCNDAVLDDWIAERRLHPPVVDERSVDAEPWARPLRRAGFHVAAVAAAGKPFAIVDGSANQCFLATAGNDAKLSLRAAGGAWVVSHATGALAWCASAAATRTVWREGNAALVVLSAPAERVGGRLGVRECAALAGLAVLPEATWLADEDLGWSAAALLRASTLAAAASGPLPPLPASPDLRVIAVALSSHASVAAEPANVVVACDPALDVDAGARDSLCASAEAVAWWRRGEDHASSARATLPPWLSVFEGRHEPDAVARIPELLSLARRLARDGYEPTFLEGVTELPQGVRVIGRAGEDAVVAVGLTAKAPWVFPYTDRVPWDLGDPPVEVPIEPGKSVTLRAASPSNVTPDKRRTVVFRHATIR